MKRDFHTMCSHSNKNFGDILQLMNLHHLRRAVTRKYHGFAPPTKESEANLGMTLGVKPSKRQKHHLEEKIKLADAELKGGKVGECSKDVGH